MEEKGNHLVEIAIDKVSIGYILISVQATMVNYETIFENNVYLVSKTTILVILNGYLVLSISTMNVIRLNKGNSLVENVVIISFYQKNSSGYVQMNI